MVLLVWRSVINWVFKNFKILNVILRGKKISIDSILKKLWIVVVLKVCWNLFFFVIWLRFIKVLVILVLMLVFIIMGIVIVMGKLFVIILIIIEVIVFEDWISVVYIILIINFMIGLEVKLKRDFVWLLVVNLNLLLIMLIVNNII